MLEAVLLDFGHTIVDFALNERALLAAYEEVREILAAYVVGELPSAASMVQSVSVRLAQRIHESYLAQQLQELDVFAELAALFGEQNLRLPADLIRRVAEIEHRALMAELFVSPANLQALHALKSEGFRLGLVSNITYHGDFVRGDLDRLGLLDLLDTVILSSEVGVRKPHPKIYQAALSALGLSGASVLFVGDRLREDIAGPRQAGMRAILTREFRAEGQAPGMPVPDAVIDALAELPAVAARFRLAAAQ